MKKASQEVKTDEILTAHVLFVICISVTALHSCYSLHLCYNFALVLQLCTRVT